MASQSLESTSNNSDVTPSESESSHNATNGRNKRPPIPLENEQLKRSCMKLYLQEETADVYFLFHTTGEDKRLPAHKYMLGISSPVFYAMFYGNLKEEGDVRIVDTTMDAFKEFLQFFYLDKVVLTIENIAEVMNLVNKYSVLKCFDTCDTFMMVNLSIDDICLGLELAATFDRSELRQFCLKKIMEEPLKVFALESFKKCSSESLKLILECKQFKCEEKCIFDACMIWSENACVKHDLDSSDMLNRRKVLGDCFNLIQFAVMKPVDVSKCISTHNDMFTREELVEIIAILSSDNTTKPKYFTNNTRVQQYDKWDENAVMVFSQINAPVVYINQIETTMLKTNKTLLLGAVATKIVNPCTANKKELSSILKILKIVDFKNNASMNEQILLEQPFIIALGGTFVPTNITKLVKPITIQPDNHYLIQIQFDSSWSHAAYHTEKSKGAQYRFLKEYTFVFGGGFISHLYFN